jgi:basic membrane protein A and related proteins
VKFRTRLAAGVVACVAAVFAITAATAVAAPATSTATLKVGLVTDIGGLNDHGFNHLAYLGLQKAAKKLHVQTRVLESHANSDYIPNMSTLAQQGYDLVIAVGFLMADSVTTVAEQFPNTKFMIIDSTWPDGGPSNLEGTVFHEEEAGYLVGYLSGLLYPKKGSVFSTVGGQKIPPVDHYIAGFQAGVKKANKGAKLLNGYSQDFVAQDKCKNLALQQIQQGSKVVFQVAGGCGLGALDAAKQKHVWGIGVDADQAYIGPQVLTSAMKRVDNDVFTTVKQVQSGQFHGGETFEFSLENDGVGMGKVSSKVPQDIVDKTKALEPKIASGAISVPTTVP